MALTSVWSALVVRLQVPLGARTRVVFELEHLLVDGAPPWNISCNITKVREHHLVPSFVLLHI